MVTKKKLNEWIKAICVVRETIYDEWGSRDPRLKELRLYLRYLLHKKTYCKNIPTCPTCKNYMDSGERLIEVTVERKGGYAPGLYYERSIRCALGKRMVNENCWESKKQARGNNER